MKINKTFEQAIFVIIILALQKEHKPIKSHLLSNILQVSDSYLKKILMKLSKNKLVFANASKQGGYQLNKSIEEISLKDIYFALELNQDSINFSHLADTIFDDKNHVKESELKILNTLNNGMLKFYNELDTLKLSDLLHKEAYINGVVDWENKI